MISLFARHPTAANLLMGVLILLGLITLPTLLRETFPDITPQQIEVRVVYPGASASEIEESVCQRIEDAVDGIQYVREVVSEAREGLAVVKIEMEDGGDIIVFKDEVNTELDAIRNDLPEDSEDPSVRQLGLDNARAVRAHHGRDVGRRSKSLLRRPQTAYAAHARNIPCRSEWIF